MTDSKQIEDAFIATVFKELGEAEYKLARWNPGAEPWHYWSRETIENALRDSAAAELIKVVLLFQEQKWGLTGYDGGMEIRRRALAAIQKAGL